MLTYPFTSDADADALRWPDDDERRVSPRLANPLSDEQPKLRAAILPTLLVAAQRNVSRGFDDAAIFEMGAVFRGPAGSQHAPRPGVDQRPSDEEWQQLQDLLPDQPTHLGAVFTGNRVAKTWADDAEAFTWADALSVAQDVCQVLGVDYVVERGADPSFHPGRCAQVMVDGEPVAIAGELHPAVTEAWGLPPRSCALELDISRAIESSPEVRPAPDFSSHPIAKEDIALVVAGDVSARDVAASIEGERASYSRACHCSMSTRATRCPTDISRWHSPFVSGPRIERSAPRSWPVFVNRSCRARPRTWGRGCGNGRSSGTGHGPRGRKYVHMRILFP